MTKEELKKEAEEYAKENNILICCDCNYYESEEDLLDAYLAGAEPREKRIAELETENNKLLDVINNQDVKIADLEKENAELEAQIEKMKCCGNCKNEGDYKEPYRYGTGWCNICKRHKVAKGNFDKWEIKEK